jgi:hypothetical protein
MRTSAPKLNFEELSDRMNAFYLVARRAMRRPILFREEERAIKQWFADRGIELELNDG